MDAKMKTADGQVSLGSVPRLDTMLMLQDEVLHARAMHPGRAHLLAALTEEVGELAQALLDHGNGPMANLEAKQVACVALRILEEGDADFDAQAAEPETAAAADPRPAKPGCKRIKWNRKAKAAKSTAKPAAAAGAPCTICGGPVDRSGTGGWQRKLCGKCSGEGHKARSAAGARPKTIRCACGVEVQVAPAGIVPSRCKACAGKARYAAKKTAVAKPAAPAPASIPATAEPTSANRVDRIRAIDRNVAAAYAEARGEGAGA